MLAPTVVRRGNQPLTERYIATPGVPMVGAILYLTATLLRERRRPSSYLARLAHLCLLVPALMRSLAVLLPS